MLPDPREREATFSVAVESVPLLAMVTAAAPLLTSSAPTVSVTKALASPVSLTPPPLRLIPTLSAQRPWSPAPVKITLLLMFNKLFGRKMTVLLLAPVEAFTREPVAAVRLTVAELPISSVPEPMGLAPPGAPPVWIVSVLPRLTTVPPV